RRVPPMPSGAAMTVGPPCALAPSATKLAVSRSPPSAAMEAQCQKPRLRLTGSMPFSFLPVRALVDAASGPDGHGHSEPAGEACPDECLPQWILRLAQDDGPCR